MENNKRLAELLGIYKYQYFYGRGLDLLPMWFSKEFILKQAFYFQKKFSGKYLNKIQEVRKIYPIWENPVNILHLLDSIRKTVTNLTINTDTEGTITISWFDSETQLEEEYLNISKNFSEAIILTAIKLTEYLYISDRFQEITNKAQWKY